MRAGLLTEVITLLKCSMVKDIYGSESKTWEVLKTIKASKQKFTGNRITSDYEVINTSTLIFDVRIYHDINEQMRIRYNNDIYVILSIDCDKTKQLKTIKCEKINE